MSKAMTRIKIGILGASGYTGAELVRLLAGHPAAEISLLCAESKAGGTMADSYPHLSGLSLPPLVRIDAADFSSLDLVFACLPHGTTQEVIAGLPEHLRVIDLSADFRLADPLLYAQWYGAPHKAPHLQAKAVYGLSELMRDKIKTARLVANPGCYPTSILLPLMPLLSAHKILPHDIVIDSKSGVSGAGRAAKESSLYTEVAEGIAAYGVASHRHSPEIEQLLSHSAGQNVAVSFTPHLMPMNRGILSTIYVRLAEGVSSEAAQAVLAKTYQGEPFVSVLPLGQVPSTRHVRGTNQCRIGLVADRSPGRLILVSVIDNLLKGASGQAVQNMNIMFGLNEPTGLGALALFP